jgi:two-component system, OmpR family, sensor kinase
MAAEGATAAGTTTSGTTDRLPDIAAAPGAAPGSTLTSVRRIASSIRVRIVIGYLVLIAVALTVTIVIARHVQAARIDREVESGLVQEAEEFRRVAGSGSFDVRSLFNEFFNRHVAGDHEAYYTIPLDGGEFDEGIRRSFGAPEVIVDDEELVRSWASTDHVTFATVDTAAGEARVLALPVTGSATPPAVRDVIDQAAGAEPAERVLGVFVVAHFMDAHFQELSDLVRLLVLAGLVVLVITTGLVWALAGRIVAPVRELTLAARAVSHSDLSARIPVGGPGELAELGTTFNEMVERLDRGFRAQRQFLDDIAHDLRTPLTIAQGHLETLGDDPVEREDTVSIVLDELGRMGRSVTDLLVLAKAEQPHFLRLQAIDYGDFANDLLQRASGLAARKWVIDAAPRPGVVAGEADFDRLIEAMLNLVTNAVQHTVEGDEIGIGVVAVQRQQVRLWVRDRGPGVDVADAEVLFERFRRGHTAGARRRDGSHHDGMGLGLSIVDAIARAHGGRASHEPSDGGGATFVLEIPLEPPIDAADQESQ